MCKDNVQSDRELIRKLRRKAELCRFSHAELKEEFAKRRNWKEFTVVLLSVTLAALIGLYYRRLFENEWILTIIFLLPLIITIIQTLDHTVFKWTHKIALHESSVAIWGDWIREADFLEQQIRQYSNELVNEKMDNIQEKYIRCMGSTEQIPNRRFLMYKLKYRIQVLKSKEMDGMSLDDLEKLK